MNIELKKIQTDELDKFRREMQLSFEQGVLDRFGDITAAPVPPLNDVDKALTDSTCDVFFIIADGIPSGGAIIRCGKNGRYSLDLFFVFPKFLNKKIGFAAWQTIEKYYSDAKIWETHTPYFDRRNIHFYLNKCQFKIVEFFNKFHHEANDISDEFKDPESAGFFRFEKVIKK